jgi:hypothetical protein
MTSLASRDRGGRARKVALGVIGASLVLGMAACSGGSSDPSASQTTTTPPAAAPALAAGPGMAGYARGVIGTITAENGSTWTLNARNGSTYTVSITPQTQFGTPRTPGTASQFPVGSTVRVGGTPNGNTITATRITAPRARNSTSTPPPTPTS